MICQVRPESKAAEKKQTEWLHLEKVVELSVVVLTCFASGGFAHLG